MKSKIRSISSVIGSDLFLVAELKENIYLFRKGEAKKIFSYKINLEFDKYRLQIIPEKNVFIAASYYEGIDGYSLSKGLKLWSRNDIKKIQSLRRKPVTDEICCFLDKDKTVILDPLTGAMNHVLKKTSELYFSNCGTYVLDAAKKSYILKKDSITKFHIQPESFALLDAAFSEDVVGISESAKNVRFYSLQNGNLLGTFIPEPGYHVLSMQYCDEKNIFVCLMFGFESKGDCLLLHLNADGNEQKRFKIDDAYGFAFFPDSNCFINQYGHEIDYLTGKKLFEYNFEV